MGCLLPPRLRGSWMRKRNVKQPRAVCREDQGGSMAASFARLAQLLVGAPSGRILRMYANAEAKAGTMPGPALVTGATLPANGPSDTISVIVLPRRVIPELREVCSAGIRIVGYALQFVEASVPSPTGVRHGSRADRIGGRNTPRKGVPRWRSRILRRPGGTWPGVCR